MTRFLVTFRSHAEGPADVHFVGVTAPNALVAVQKSIRECPPVHEWVVVQASPWPHGCRTIDAAARRMTGTR